MLGDNHGIELQTGGGPMRGVRIPVIAAALSIFLPWGAAGASEKCDLAVGYLLEHQDEPEFGVTIYRCAKFWKLEFEKIYGYSANGQPQWHVLELREVPKVAADEVIVSETCSIGGVEDKGIVVVATQTDEDWFAQIRVAWRADKEHGRWISVDARTVKCWNEVAGFS